MAIDIPLHQSWRLRKARIRRRARKLGAFARAMLMAAPEARPFTPAGWLFLAGWLAMAAPPTALPAFVLASFALFILLGVAALIDALYFVLPDGPLLALAGLGLLIRVNAPPATIATSITSKYAHHADAVLLAAADAVAEKVASKIGGDS